MKTHFFKANQEEIDPWSLNFCRRRDLNPHAQWALRPEHSVSANSTTSALT
jgi:hypothetical protein